MRFFLFLSTLLSVQSLVVDRPTLNPNVILHAVAQFGPQVIGDPKFKGSSPPVTGALVGVSPKGDIIYGLPMDVDLDDYKYVLTWCEAFGVLFDYAEIK